MSNNVMDLLLSADIKKFNKPTKKVKMVRLSELLGTDVVFICEGLTPDQMEKIQENAMSIKGGDVDVNMNELQIFTVLEGVKEPNLKSKELREKYGVATPKELVKNLLLSGEITKLYNVISDLSGYGEKAIEEVKN